MERGRVAIVQLCVDDRLDHGRIRAQVMEKLRSIHLPAERVFLVNEVGGNFGENFRNTVDVFRGQGMDVVFCGILHHDDCKANQAGWRRPMEQSVAEMAAFLAGRRSLALSTRGRSARRRAT